MKINGKLCYLWRAVDHEGEVLEAVVTSKRDKAAALKLLKRIMKKYGAPRSSQSPTAVAALNSERSPIPLANQRDLCLVVETTDVNSPRDC